MRSCTAIALVCTAAFLRSQGLRIAPANATVLPRRTTHFEMAGRLPEGRGAHWEVPPGGGSISASGTYAAPALAGHYEVRLVGDDGRTLAQAEVTVPVSARIWPEEVWVEAGTYLDLSARIEGIDKDEIRWNSTMLTPTPLKPGERLRIRVPQSPGAYDVTATSAHEGVAASARIHVVLGTKGGSPELVSPADSVIVPSHGLGDRWPEGVSAELWAASETCAPGDRVHLEWRGFKGPVHWYTEDGGVVDQKGWVETDPFDTRVLVVAQSLDDPTLIARTSLWVPQVELAVEQGEHLVQVGKSLPLHAIVSRGGLSWSVETARGGSISPLGDYRAPDQPGTYTIAAASSLNPEVRKTVDVKVEQEATGAQPPWLEPFDPEHFHAEDAGVRISPAVGVLDAGTYFPFNAEPLDRGPSSDAGTHLVWTVVPLLGQGAGKMDSGGAFTADAPGLYRLEVRDSSNQARHGSALALVQSSHRAVAGIPPDLANRQETGVFAMPQGGVLFIGGDDDHGKLFANGYIREDRTGVFVPAGRLAIPRSGPSGVAAADGHVLILGGLGPWVDEKGQVRNGWVAVPEWLDTTRNTTAIPLPEIPVSEGARALRLNDGRILVSGGDHGPGLLFDPRNRRFKVLDGPPIGAAHAACLLEDGRVLLCGGFLPAKPGAAPQPSKLAWIMDPTTLRFTSVPSMAAARAGHTATALADGKVIVVGGITEGGAVKGGWTEGGRPSASVELFDPKTLSFTAAASLSQPRADHAACLLPTGQLRLMGGRSADGRFPGAVEEFDSDEGAWKVVDRPPYGLIHPVMLMMRTGGVFFIGRPVPVP